MTLVSTLVGLLQNAASMPWGSRGICEVSVVAITVELSIVAFFAIQFSQHLAHDKHISCYQEVLNKYKRICSFLATLRYIIALNNIINNNNMPKNWR